MAFLDFPSNPTTGTVYVGTNEVTYTFDGIKWIGIANKGSQGFQGVQGVQGAQGNQGVQGDLGVQGIQGAQGVQGAQGFQGYEGAQGAQGFQGFQGAQGVQGSQGVQGAQGFQGFQGDVLTFLSGTGTQILRYDNTVTIWSTANLQEVTSSGNNTDVSILISNTATSTDTNTGALIVSGGVGIGGNLNVGNLVSINQVQESFVTINNAVGVVNHNTALTKIFNHTNIQNTFTVNLTNFTLDSNFSTVVVLLLNQGAVAHTPVNLQINSIQNTVVWQGGVQPVSVSSSTEVLTYTIFNNSGSYTVLGQLVTFG